ncbi:MAG: hypothetical protein LKF99_05065 [Bifidobacterium sp.]|jgi:hypothetical protein|nr:hypothetical protein [Bifidobacterium sp.]
MSDSQHQPQFGGADVTQQPQNPPAQPQYGQIAQPEYGALASQFPAGYDPYVFGRPDDATKTQGASGNAGTAGQQNGGYGSQPVRPAGHDASGPVSPYNPQNGGHEPGRPGGWPVRPRMLNGVNLNDPNQNPLYGRWDSYAVVAFVISLFNVPVFPALMGGLAMWRTRTFHMKGFWLALAAVILNVLMTLLDIWMLSKGVSTEELYQWMLQQLSGGSGQGGSGSVSV